MMFLPILRADKLFWDDMADMADISGLWNLLSS